MLRGGITKCKTIWWTMNSVAYDSSEDFRYLRHLLQDEFGVVLVEDQEQQVTDRLDALMEENDIDSLQSLTEKLHGPEASGLRTAVLHAITEHNVDWFAYPEIMSVFREYVLPNIAKDRTEPYRIWVVGCGYGQTAFSMAMAADRYMKTDNLTLPIEIIATDSSKVTVDEASKATFKSSFMYGLDDVERNRYMQQDDGGNWAVSENIRSMVSFSTANPLYLESGDIGPFDLIICPDILVYYTVSSKKQVLDSFADSLNRSGMLIAGPHEPVVPFCKRFTMVEHDSGTFYRKQN